MLYVKREKLYDAMNAIRALIGDMRNEEGGRVVARTWGDDDLKNAVLGVLTILTGYPVSPDDLAYMERLKPIPYPTSTPCGGPEPDFNKRGVKKIQECKIEMPFKDVD